MNNYLLPIRNNAYVHAFKNSIFRNFLDNAAKIVKLNAFY